ncbi:alanine racemase [Asanoa sp. WMMD1127]|uniref:alanine racemase n=1 Tax=Asanoa sp. WMMD1127 TaxID=3016107 RepID=UPI0024178C46|nr:alanine racemase [Asanoa sp. WMMD1127]MDG4821396.1 alanine racemase [Asanoa sp. WMMD1127]
MIPLSALPTPALLVDLDRLERNIAAMAGAFAAAGVALRPHIKTSKCWEVARRQLDAGAIGFTCSTAAEVAWLQSRGVGDLLWAHIPIGPRKVAFVVDSIAQHGGGLTVSLDSVEAARPLSAAAVTAGVTVPFVLEINTGHARLGVEPASAVATATAIAALPGLRLRGVLTHEGHISVLASRPDLEQAGAAAGTLLVSVADALRAAGLPVEVVSVGSTPGATSAPFVPGITEGRPGTYVYFDGNQTRLGSCSLDQCAQTVLARVASVQRAGRPIIDAGIKAMSSDTIAAAGGVGVVLDRADVTFPEANEEHGFLSDGGEVPLAVGDLVRLVPNHACGTTNMWSHLYAVRGDVAVERWEISARY